MASLKFKTQYICQKCQAVSAKWLGRCPSCNAWDTYVEDVIAVGGKENASGGNTYKNLSNNKLQSQILHIGAVESISEKRLITHDHELNRVTGGGIVPGAITLIGGEPGIGKSTLMLQLALELQPYKVLYISGEESASQIKLRADRMGTKNSNCFLLTETNLFEIIQHLKTFAPDLVIIDSIQTLQSPAIESAAGSISQIRECTAELQQYAKNFQVPVFLIGHITKDGNIAGPKILEHMVDTVLQFEGEHHYAYRLLRTKKNRFGSTAELGIYEMNQNGLRQVLNPSELLISENIRQLSGISIAATIEGMRPLMIETQALVSRSAYGTPQRSANGYDSRRMSMLLAVLEKRCGFKFGDKDVFVNIAGGIKPEDPAIDLAIICALLSSFEDVTIPSKVCFAGEVGLSGEIRSVNRLEQRISEAQKLGFETIFISANNKGMDTKKFKIKIQQVATVEEVYEKLLK